MNKLVPCILMILLSGSIIGSGENNTNISSTQNRDLYITADTTEVFARTATNIMFTVKRDCGTEDNEICIQVYPPPKVPVKDAIIIISMNNNEIGRGITNNNGESTIPINVSSSGTLYVKAIKQGYNPAYMAINSIYIPPTTEAPKGKFRVGPTVRLRPLNDVINKSADGIVELYMDNPSLNDITLNVDVRVSVPSGIHVYGQGFGEAAAAGTVYGKFDVPPGMARTIYLTIKAEKVGDFYAHFSGLYWPGDNKDAYQPISLTHPFKVYEYSSNPTRPESPSSPDNRQIPTISGITAIFIIFMIFALFRKE